MPRPKNQQRNAVPIAYPSSPGAPGSSSEVLCISLTMKIATNKKYALKAQPIQYRTVPIRVTMRLGFSIRSALAQETTTHAAPAIITPVTLPANKCKGRLFVRRPWDAPYKRPSPMAAAPNFQPMAKALDLHRTALEARAATIGSQPSASTITAGPCRDGGRLSTNIKSQDRWRLSCSKDTPMRNSLIIHSNCRLRHKSIKIVAFNPMIGAGDRVP
jgi:hypothetical protein